MRAGGDGYYDMFRHRVIFPILDLQDRPVAFGGRALDETQPKYLNSKETAVFVKGKTLYPLNWAREAIRQHDEVVVVEGNMDVLTCHQFGITNAVATLGTALTAEQVLGLKRFAGKAVLVYDADAAGKAAMERAQGLFEEAELPVRVAVLPSGDPDGFLRTAGPQKFGELVANAVPIFDYQVTLAASRYDAKTVEGKVRIVDALLPSIAAVSNPVRQAEYLRSLAQRFDLAEDAVRQRLTARGRPPEAHRGQPPSAPPADRARNQAERLLIHLMVHDPALRPIVGGVLVPGDFVNPPHGRLARVLFATPDADVDRLREGLEDEDTQGLLMRLVFEEPPVAEKEKEQVVRETIDYISVRVPAAQQRQALARQIHQAQAAGDLQQVRQLQMAYVKLIGPSGHETGSSPVPGGPTTPAPKGGDNHGQKESA
jgi:DNA primase